MGRIAPRTDPYSSPVRRHRHYKTKRDQILRQLCKASYINASQFAIIWTSSRGEVETYASEAFQPRLSTWFNNGIVDDAKTIALNAAAMAIERRSREKLMGGDIEEEGESSSEDMHEDEPEHEHEHEVAERGLWPETEAPVAPPPLPSIVKDEAGEFNGSNTTQRAAQLALSGKGQPPLRRAASLPGAPPQFRSSQHILTHQRRPSSSSLTTSQDLRPLVIGNEQEVESFYETRFRQLQQLVCKIVAKAWIKVIEPKKQTKFPYNRGEDSKPDWWPEEARHKEPDHLMKPERLLLLMTMLRCGHVSASRLELATAEVSSNIPSDKWDLLREIYRVAREEERFRAGEIDASTKIMVIAADRFANADTESLSPLEPPPCSAEQARSVFNLNVPAAPTITPTATPEIVQENLFQSPAHLQMIQQHYFSQQADVQAYQERTMAQHHIYPNQITLFDQSQRAPMHHHPNTQQGPMRQHHQQQQPQSQPPQQKTPLNVPIYSQWQQEYSPPLAPQPGHPVFHFPSAQQQQPFYSYLRQSMPHSPPTTGQSRGLQEHGSSPQLPTPYKGRLVDTPGGRAAAHAISFSEFLEQSPMPGNQTRSHELLLSSDAEPKFSAEE